MPATLSSCWRLFRRLSCSEGRGISAWRSAGMPVVASESIALIGLSSLPSRFWMVESDALANGAARAVTPAARPTAATIRRVEIMFRTTPPHLWRSRARCVTHPSGAAFRLRLPSLARRRSLVGEALRGPLLVGSRPSEEVSMGTTATPAFSADTLRRGVEGHTATDLLSLYADDAQ